MKKKTITGWCPYRMESIFEDCSLGIYKTKEQAQVTHTFCFYGTPDARLNKVRKVKITIEEIE